MTLDEALAIILGPEVADAISMKQGRHWAVAAAMARATTDQNPEAIAAIRAHVAAQKDPTMADTLESLDTELQEQKRMNASLFDLLRRVQAALPDPDGRLGPMIGEVERTKQALDDCQRMIEQKRDSK